MAPPNTDDSGTRPEAIKQRTVSPNDLTKSTFYEGDESRGSTNFQTSIESWGVIEPVLAHVEDGHLAVFEGWQRVLNARETNTAVPVWIPEDGTWSDEKVLLARLLANTTSHREELSWLHRAWLLADLWEQIGESKQPSPRDIADTLNLTEPTARRWLEPLRPEWDGTILDQDMYDGEQIRQADGSDTEVIEGLRIRDVHDGINPSRLRDIRTIVYESSHCGSNRSLLVDLLHSYIRGDITYEELNQLKERVKEETLPARKALEDIRQTEYQTVEATLEGPVAQKVSVLSEQTGKSANELIEEGTVKLVDGEGLQTVSQEDSTEECLGQFDYLQQHVDGPLPEPDVRLCSNEQMVQLSAEDIALTVTSPPYNVAREYGEATNDNHPYEAYLADIIRETFAEVYRLTVEGGYCCIVVALLIDVDSDELETPVGAPIAADVIDVVTTDGWQLFDLVIWDKGFNQAGLRNQEFPFPESRLNNFAEAIIVLKKPGKRDVSSQRREQSKIIRRDTVEDHDLRDNVWRISPAVWEPTYTDTGNTAQFPEELAKRCILHWSYVGDTVLDPYAGRGTTLKMGKHLYRESIGYEIQEELEQDIREYVGIN